MEQRIQKMERKKTKKKTNQSIFTTVNSPLGEIIIIIINNNRATRALEIKVFRLQIIMPAKFSDERRIIGWEAKNRAFEKGQLEKKTKKTNESSSDWR